MLHPKLNTIGMISVMTHITLAAKTSKLDENHQQAKIRPINGPGSAGLQIVNHRTLGSPFSAWRRNQ
jgi:hypothetical protein